LSGDPNQVSGNAREQRVQHESVSIGSENLWSVAPFTMARVFQQGRKLGKLCNLTIPFGTRDFKSDPFIF